MYVSSQINAGQIDSYHLDDGYRLSYGGLDYLALNTHRRNNTIYSLGNQIGVGKESDIYIAASSTNRLQVVKVHRLGRISFRSVKSKRDYLRNRTTGSWMYLSRLAAQKEFEVMKVLRREGFAVPEPIAWSRHTVVMEFVDAFPLRMIDSVAEPGKMYAELMDMIVQLASRGLIHGDFNEFNILIQELHSSDDSVAAKPVLIDFPQVVSTNHANAQMYFDRDVSCVKRYFERRFKYVSDEPGPFFRDAIEQLDAEARLDVEVEASGFSKKMARELERYVEETEERNGGMERQSEDEEPLEDDNDNGEPNDDALEGPDDPTLAEQLDCLSMQDNPKAKRTAAMSYGLMPIELPFEHDVSAEETHRKKAAAGWAI